MLTLKSVQPGDLVGTKEVLFSREGQVPEVREVAATELIDHAISLQALTAVLADGLQHAESRLADLYRPADEILVHQVSHGVQGVDTEFAVGVAHGVRSFEGAAA